MCEEWRVMLNCDEIFAQYLRHISTMVNEQFYKTMVRFVLLYRDCFNQFGWLKKAEADCREARITLEEKNVQARVDSYKEMINVYEFSCINNGELLPEICNEFVTIYLNDKKEIAGFERGEAIDFVRHFCHWLFINGHTCSKLSMIH
jgi:lipopolysaccharide biosynthesis regulator YciM